MHNCYTKEIHKFCRPFPHQVVWIRIRIIRLDPYPLHETNLVWIREAQHHQYYKNIISTFKWLEMLFSFCCQVYLPFSLFHLIFLTYYVQLYFFSSQSLQWITKYLRYKSWPLLPLPPVPLGEGAFDK